MHDQRTTASVERYLVALKGEEDPDPIVRALLARAANRLQGLCTNMLRRHYPKLMRGPASIQEEETLSLLVERLLKAMRQVKPTTVREFFALANRHLRWELNDFARQMGRRPPPAPLTDDVTAPRNVPTEGGCITQILEAIERLPEDLREVFSLVHIHGLTHDETADVLGVSTKTVQRRIQQSTMALASELREVVGGELGLGAMGDDSASSGATHRA